MQAPDAGQILRFLAALPLSGRTIPAPVGEQRGFEAMPAGWEPALLGWRQQMGLGEPGGFCSTAIAGMLADPYPGQPLQTYTELCTPISPKKMSFAEHFSRHITFPRWTSKKPRVWKQICAPVCKQGGKKKKKKN